MRMTGRTMFITGGTSGIGRGLAEAFHERGNQVIISGRREQRLAELCAAHPGMRSYVLDVAKPEMIREVAGKVISKFPSLDCVINNAGIQRRVNFAPGGAVDDGAVAEEININLLGAIRVTTAFVSHLSARPDATLVHVSSGLAFVPMAHTPVYSATKAAFHAWTLCLRRQLRETSIKVIELIPPYTDTELGWPGKVAESRARGRAPMPLADFVAEAMKELETDADEVAVGDAKRLFAAASPEKVRQAFAAMNG